MKRRIIIISIVLIVSAFQSCYFDNAETLNPDLGTNCDLTNVTYAGTVVPILSSYCYACHTAATSGSSGGGIILDNYAALKVYVDNNKLWGAVSHTSGVSPMPKGGTKLDNCTLQKIKKWIDDGAKNN